MFIYKNKILRNADGGGSGGTSTPAPTPTPTASWFDPLDAEVKGYVQTRGLDKKTAVEAFTEAYKAHREAEKLIGAPANEIVRLPKDPNAAEWKNVWERLGKPKEAKEYDLSTVKRAGDKPLDDALAETMRQAAYNSNVSKEAATRMASDVVKYLDGVETARAAADADKLATERAELKKNWGNNEAANMVVARAAATALGVAPEAVAAMEKIVGYAKVMEMFRTIGTKIGEDRFITPSRGGAGGVMTRDQASAELVALKADKAWVGRYMNGGVEEKRKMEALQRIVVGVS